MSEECTITDRQFKLAMKQWADWKAYALELQERLAKYEGGSPMILNADQQPVHCWACGAKQAQIDRLMLEYCPDEMTPKQMQEWGNNQRPAEQAEQEPVAWHEPNAYGNVTVYEKWAKENGWQPLYTAPPKREWVDLTDDEVWKIYGITGLGNGMALRFARAVIAAHKAKQVGGFREVNI